LLLTATMASWIEMGHPANWTTMQDLVKHCHRNYPSYNDVISILLHYEPRYSHIAHFTDTSQQVYGAVAYLVQGPQSEILMSKARTAPLKQQTLPRLELIAAVPTTVHFHINTHLYHMYFFWINYVCRGSGFQSLITERKKEKIYMNQCSSLIVENIHSLIEGQKG